MILKYGDMWSVYTEADLFLITASATVVGSGELVMNDGLAQEARDKFKAFGIARSLGDAVASRAREEWGDRAVVWEHIEGSVKTYKPYYLLISDQWPDARLGLFQNRNVHVDEPDEFLIAGAADALREWAEDKREEMQRKPVICLEYPGGDTLSLAVVRPLLAELPDTVQVWRANHETEWELTTEDFSELAAADQEHFVIAACRIEDVDVGNYDDALHALFNGYLKDTWHGRLYQHLAVMAYLEAEGSERERIDGAHVRARSEIGRLVVDKNSHRSYTGP